MPLSPRIGLSLAVIGSSLVFAEEAPLEAWIEEEGGGLLYLHATTDLGRGYQVEWSAVLGPEQWTPALAQPVQGTGGRQAFLLGQWPWFDGVPPVHPPRRDFTVVSFSDGTSLAQWLAGDGAMVRRRVALDFRRIPRVASAVLDDTTVVTRTQVALEPSSVALAVLPDPDPIIQEAIEALVEAYPLLEFSQPGTVVRESAESGALTGAKFWRLRRIDGDSDGDGLTDFDEWQNTGTNPFEADTDGDGVNDRAEGEAGSSPLRFFEGRPGVVRRPSRWADVPLAGPEEWLNEPLVVEVRTPDGAPAVNAPVTIAASAGGIDLWAVPLAARLARPVVAARTDAAGHLAIAWRSGDTPNVAALIHAWCGDGLSYQGTHFLVHTVRAMPAVPSGVLAWLKSDEGVTVGADGRVESWADVARSVTATATGDQRPLRPLTGPMPLIEFTGGHRLGFAAPLGGPTMSAIVAAQPTTVRTQPPVNAADPVNRTAGLSGQRYVLAGAVAASGSPWLHTPPVARVLQTTQYFSRYSAEYFTVDPVFGFRGYNCRDITYSFGQLPANLPLSQVPSVRYDVTAGALPDPGPSGRQSGRTYRLNPLVANCPLRAGATVGSVLADFVLRTGLPASYEWETAVVGTYTRRAGNPIVDDFSEIYYQAKGYSPEVPEQFQLQPAAIGAVGQGLSLGANSAGYFHLAQAYAPSLGARVSPAGAGARHLTSLIVSNGRPAFFTNGLTAGASVAPAGGTATGLRHIGGLAGGTNGFAGTVGDIVLTSGALADDARRSVEDMVSERHRLNQVDRDLDTLPDWWERRCFAGGPAAVPAADSDTDGLSNVLERARFTLPELADSDRDGRDDAVESAAAAITPDTDSDGFLDGADPAPADPANGRADANGDGVSDGLASLLADPGQRDSDGDTLPDLVEAVTTRTSPVAADTDGDSLPDAWETSGNLDPNDPSGDNGPAGDPDNDGRTNAAELALGTHPRVPN